LNATLSTRPVVASYCATFLKPEMLHIYRQISALQRVRPIVITQKRENAQDFPFEPVHIVSKPATHFLRRFWFRQVLDQPWHISDLELEALLRILNRTDARLLHIYFGHIAAHLLPLVRAWTRPVIVSFHGADAMVDMDKPAYRRATEQILEAVHKVFVRSESLRQAVLDLGCDQRKIAILRTGIPLDQFTYRARNIPEHGKWRLLQAGRLIEKKGYATSLRAFADVLQRYPNATLTLAGEGPLLTELHALARDLKIDHRVSFRGFVGQDELRDLFYASHIFVHPSEIGRDGNQEGVPNSMLEAMATGLPVFATHHGGIPEAIENGVSGVLVPERDHMGLSRALLKAMEDPEMFARIGREAADTVARNFDQRTQIQRLEDLYLEVMGSGQL
jgi:colanic acid/amylovoran biosynthesis glycosyltransferase